MKSAYQSIIKFLEEKDIPFERIDHEAVYTSEQAAQVRGLSLNQGAKSLLLKAGNKFILIILPGDKKLDSKKVKMLFGIKDLRFASSEEVKEIMGCEIGACYPFGNIIGIRMIIDNELATNEIISFNPGVHTQSIKLKWKDYYDAVKPELHNLSQ